MAKIIDRTALETKKFDEISTGTYFKYFDKLFVKLHDYDSDDDNTFCFDAGGSSGKGNPVHMDGNVIVTVVDVEIIVKPLGC